MFDYKEISHKVLKEYWGFDSFLKSQIEVIDVIMQGKDIVALIPTGGGKSMCFQIPAIIKEGLCLVVSPLIALISDQIKRLKMQNVPAEGLHSGMSKEEQDSVIAKLLNREIKLLYLSPERLQSSRFEQLLKGLSISFIAVDEAHCISQWGYDFRPDYLSIKSIKNLFPDVQIAAFTATANSKTLKDIKKYLQLRNPKVIRGSFLKENIRFGVINTEKKFKILTLLIREFKGSGIIYMRSRRGTVKLSNLLQKESVSAEFYHAGMSSPERENVQNEWLENKTRIIVSTTAFGMGIDKPDVRFVIHFDLPTSMEEYYQEAGRAGRDGALSNAVILYNENDLEVFKKRNLDSFPSINEIMQTFDNLKRFFEISDIDNEGLTIPFNADSFFKFNRIAITKTYKSIVELERYGFIELNTGLRDMNGSLILKLSVDELNELAGIDKLGFDILKASIFIYEDLFRFNVDISEDKIATRIGIDKKNVCDKLSELHNRGLIKYIKSNNLIITFKPYGNLEVDRKELAFRKKRILSNYKSIVEYLSFKKCRQKNILKYFDEKLNKTCNICDICQNVEGLKFRSKEFVQYRDLIDDFCFSSNTGIDDLIYIDSYMNRNKNLQMLKVLFSNGKLTLLADKVKKN